MTSIPLSDPLTGQPLAVHNSRIVPEPFLLNPQWGERYTVGVDLGQSQDFTAICVVRRLEEEGAKPIFQVGFLQRLPLGTTYPTIVAHVIERMSNPRLRGKADLVIDYTGVGRPVFDLFRVQGISPIGVSITAGHAITRDGSVWSVPKGHLISRVQALLHEKRLKIHSDLPDAAALVQELRDFRVNFTESGYAQFNARTGKHDDLVLALAIALWHSHGERSSFDNWMEFMRGEQRGAVRAAASKHQPKLVKLKRPDDSVASTLYTMTGERLDIGPDGLVEVAGDQATALLQAGWSRVEDAA
jgi:hypothetical protein